MGHNLQASVHGYEDGCVSHRNNSPVVILGLGAPSVGHPSISTCLLGHFRLQAPLSISQTLLLNDQMPLASCCILTRALATRSTDRARNFSNRTLCDTDTYSHGHPCRHVSTRLGVAEKCQIL